MCVAEGATLGQSLLTISPSNVERVAHDQISSLQTTVCFTFTAYVKFENACDADSSDLFVFVTAMVKLLEACDADSSELCVFVAGMV